MKRVKLTAIAVAIAAFCAAFAGWTGRAEADKGVPRGSIRLAFETTAFGYVALDIDDVDDDVTSRAISIGAEGLGVRAGYAVNGRIEFGGLIKFSDTSTEFGDAESSQTNILLAPYFNFNVPLGGAPFFGELLLIYISADDEDSESTSLGGALGGGFKLFLVERGSIDIGARLAYLSTDAEGDLGGESSGTTFLFTINVGVSLWFGGSTGP